MAIASCLTAVLTSTFFYLFLNSVPKGHASSFVLSFSSVLPIPILNLVASILMLAGSVGLVAAYEYPGAIQFLIAYLTATFVFLLGGGAYIFWFVHVKGGLVCHPLSSNASFRDAEAPQPEQALATVKENAVVDASATLSPHLTTEHTNAPLAHREGVVDWTRSPVAGSASGSGRNASKVSLVKGGDGGMSVRVENPLSSSARQ
jgi:hypothetical protein